MDVQRTGQAAERIPAGELALPASAVAADATAPPAQLLESFRRLAVDGTRIRMLENDGEPTLLVVTMDSSEYEPVMTAASGASGVTAVGAIESDGLALVVGSSFVSELNWLTPVGLLQVNGTIVNPLQQHGYTRVLGLRDEGLAIVDKREYHRGMFHGAVQLGPGVIERGELDILPRDLQRQPYFRAFVGTCGETMLIGASVRPTHLYTVGRLVLEFAAEAGLACDEVVNLAGDREVVLTLAAPDGSEIAYLGHPLTAKVALIGFRRKEGST